MVQGWVGKTTQFNQQGVGDVILPQLSWVTASLGKGSGPGACPCSAELHEKTSSCHHHGAAQLAEERTPSPTFHSR